MRQHIYCPDHMSVSPMKLINQLPHSLKILQTSGLLLFSCEPAGYSDLWAPSSHLADWKHCICLVGRYLQDDLLILYICSIT